MGRFLRHGVQAFPYQVPTESFQNSNRLMAIGLSLSQLNRVKAWCTYKHANTKIVDLLRPPAAFPPHLPWCRRRSVSSLHLSSFSRPIYVFAARGHESFVKRVLGRRSWPWLDHARSILRLIAIHDTLLSTELATDTDYTGLYCNLVLDGAPASSIHILQRVQQNRARQLYKNISMLFLFPVKRDLLFTNI